MDVDKEGVGAPPAHELDGFGIHAIQVEGHCPPCSERMTGDIVRVNIVALEVKIPHSTFKSSVDVPGCHVPAKGFVGSKEGADGCIWVCSKSSDVVYPPDQGVDGAIGKASCLMMYDLVASAVFLVVNLECCCGALGEQGVKGQGRA